MKAITLHAPWAWATCFLGKPVENRTWAPPPSVLTEEIAIHAGSFRLWTPEVWIEVFEVVKGLGGSNQVRAYVRLRDLCESTEKLVQEGHRFCSSIVAVARVGQVDSPLPGEPRMIGWRASNQYAWHWTGLRVLEKPIECQGAQKLWTVPLDVETRIREAL